jgi:hypothetical protein
MTLLADEITALRLWECVDEERKGWLDFNNFKRLIEGYRINAYGWKLDDLMNEFQTILKDHPNEIIGTETDPKFRFDFA